MTEGEISNQNINKPQSSEVTTQVSTQSNEAAGGPASEVRSVVTGKSTLVLYVGLGLMVLSLLLASILWLVGNTF